MERLQAYKFQLRPKAEQETQMRRFAGCCRFLWNKALALEKEAYEKGEKRNGYYKLAALLRDWKAQEETAFLTEAHSQILQQTLKDLDRAYVNFFQKRAELPRFKKKGTHDAFRYPQGFKLDESNSRIFLPKIGWVRYRKSRDTEGAPKQVTVSLSAGKWHVAIQTEREVETPAHASESAIGIDMGIVRFAAFSDGNCLTPLNSFRKYERKLAAMQRKLSKKIKFSANWQKQKATVQRLHKKIADVRTDFLHKATTTISKNHALVVMEDLKVRNMSRSASGSSDNPGRHVRAKSGLNKSILDQGWFEFRRQLGYKTAWAGGQVILVPPQYTSQTCHVCGNVDKNNRISQAQFVCTACGHEANADINAALNILAAGLAVSACGVGKAQAPMMKQEPAYGASVRTLPIGIPSL
ncbi:MAG: transposase [Desulfovibrio sp.]|jgi:putative transposase|nr:transposase [Desulfovibrio sp.]